MNLIFIGPQGSGKGTQAKIIAEKLNIAHISTGDLLRNIEGEFKKQVDEYMNSGRLLPDSLMIDILKKRLIKEDCKNGFILDGFPRNISQAKTLDKEIKIDKVIEISISNHEAIKRISSRLSCKKCGAVFNLITNPPKQDKICDKCLSELFKRTDDTEDAIKKRLQTYHKDTKPILAHYKSIKINGEQPIERVTEDILKVLS